MRTHTLNVKRTFVPLLLSTPTRGVEGRGSWQQGCAAKAISSIRQRSASYPRRRIYVSALYSPQHVIWRALLDDLLVLRLLGKGLGCLCLFCHRGAVFLRGESTFMFHMNARTLYGGGGLVRGEIDLHHLVDRAADEHHLGALCDANRSQRGVVILDGTCSRGSCPHTNLNIRSPTSPPGPALI